ncbi:unnamed protein product [Symbiodinium natans]|uniref:Uncharacterized protein n=1 Tax=Symbiodinium natans TaxID=878477 RepID=A0A812I8E5_9DINO|nr:unnamed protein product [Symbiodinium natans]
MLMKSLVSQQEPLEAFGLPSSGASAPAWGRQLFGGDRMASHGFCYMFQVAPSSEGQRTSLLQAGSYFHGILTSECEWRKQEDNGPTDVQYKPNSPVGSNSTAPWRFVQVLLCVLLLSQLARSW